MNGENRHQIIKSQGFHDTDEFDDSPTDSVRILALGDSFTFGVSEQLSSSWVELLEKHTFEVGKRTVVWNTGMPGKVTIIT